MNVIETLRFSIVETGLLAVTDTRLVTDLGFSR